MVPSTVRGPKEGFALSATTTWWWRGSLLAAAPPADHHLRVAEATLAGMKGATAAEKEKKEKFANHEQQSYKRADCSSFLKSRVSKFSASSMASAFLN